MLIYNVKAREAAPIRAIPLFSPGFFDPLSVMEMLVNVGDFGEAPALNPFTVDKYGQTIQLHPLALKYDLDTVANMGRTATIEEKLNAMPANVMVWLDEAKAMYDFLDEQFWLQESQSARRETMRDWFTQPYCSDAVRKIVLEGLSHMTQPGQTKSASVNKRKRDVKGTNCDVQTVAERLAKEYYTKINKWPLKKELVSQIKEQLPDRSDAEDKTIEREFKVTWKKRSEPF